MSAVLSRSQSTWVIFLSFILAGILTVVPMPDFITFYRPEWVALTLIYWVMALPHRVGLLTAWVTGFFLDVLEGSLLGLNALALTVVAYLVMSLYRRMRMFTAIQQSLTVFILVGIHQLISFWILTASNENTSPNLLFMISAITSALVWPMVFIVLRYMRRYFEVN